MSITKLAVTVGLVVIVVLVLAQAIVIVAPYIALICVVGFLVWLVSTDPDDPQARE